MNNDDYTIVGNTLVKDNYCGKISFNYIDFKVIEIWIEVRKFYCGSKNKPQIFKPVDSMMLACGDIRDINGYIDLESIFMIFSEIIEKDKGSDEQ